VADDITAISTVYRRMLQWKNYYYWSTFAKLSQLDLCRCFMNHNLHQMLTHIQKGCHTGWNVQHCIARNISTAFIIHCCTLKS